MTEDEAALPREQPADTSGEAIQSSADPAERAQIVGVVQASLFSGPLPPPEVLAQYEGIRPGAADRIFTMAESQQAHRQALEQVAVSNDARRSMAGLIAGVIVALGQPVWGVATAFGAIATLVGVFVYGTHIRRKERTTRLQETLNPTVDVAEPADEQPSGPQLPRE